MRWNDRNITITDATDLSGMSRALPAVIDKITFLKSVLRPGVSIVECDAKQYRALPGINAGSLIAYSKSLSHLDAYRAGTPDTKARAFGRLVHTIALEPDKISVEYFVLPEFKYDARTNAGKAERAEEKILAGDRERVAPADYKKAERMAAAFNTQLAGVDSNEYVFNELTLYDSARGWKCRIDRVKITRFNQELARLSLIDLKTCADALNFKRSDAQNAGLQLSFYEQFFDPTKFLRSHKIIAAVSADPYICAQYYAPAVSLGVLNDLCDGIINRVRYGAEIGDISKRFLTV